MRKINVCLRSKHRIAVRTKNTLKPTEPLQIQRMVNLSFIFSTYDDVKHIGEDGDASRQKERGGSRRDINVAC